MAADRRHRCKDGRDAPTPQDWAAFAHIIQDKYCKGYSLPQLQEYMHSNHQFHASGRQFKTKFKGWGLPPKRITRPHYLAMKKVIEDQPDLAQSIVFLAWRGQQRVKITSREINKELGRPRQRESLESITLDEAKTTLQQAGCEYFLNGQCPVDDLQMHDQPYSSEGDVSEGPSTPTSFDVSPMSNGDRPCMEPSLTLSAPCHFTFGVMDGYDFYFSPISLLSPRNLDDESHQSCLPPPKRSSNFKDPKRMVQSWADPWLQDSSPSHTVDLDGGKQDGLKKFEFLLSTDPSNPYIFPALLQMMEVLLANDHRQNAEDFVVKSCEVFDAVGVRPNSAKQDIQGISLKPMFMYIKAAVQKNTAVESECGTILPSNAAFFAQQLGEDHPHVHTANLFFAWHLMKRGEYAQVLELLANLGEEASSEVSWKFYRYNILAVSGQAYAALGNHAMACLFFEQAVGSLEHWPNLAAHLKPLSWDTALEWAKSQAQTGHHEAAMAAFEEVIRQRSGRFNHKHGKTWHAIITYRDQLVAWGRHRDAEELEACHVRKFEKEWYEESGTAETGWEVPLEYRDVRIPSYANVETRHILTPTTQALVERAFSRSCR